MEECATSIWMAGSSREWRTDGVTDLDVERAIRGDESAFERLYRRNVARVHGLARRMLGCGAEADDATQEAFVRAWRSLAGFRAESSFETWLYRIARHAILNRLRDRGRLDELPAEGISELQQPGATPGARLDLEAGIAGLPTCARAVFVLHDVEGATHDEIATLMGITKGTSKSQLHRARMCLRRYLAPAEEER